MIFNNDLVYHRFLARHAGLWGEVGVFDDPAYLASLRRSRRALGLPDDRWIASKLSPGRPVRSKPGEAGRSPLQSTPSERTCRHEHA